MKKILIYYHHFGGLGHGTRVYSMCKELKDHEIIVLNSGLPQPELKIAKFAKVLNLPPFTAKDGLFSGLDSKEGNSITFQKREKIIDAIISKFQPEIAIFEHYPFGRASLSKEIESTIKKLPNCNIYGSVRDIVTQDIDVEKLKNSITDLNGIFVHSDDNLITNINLDKIKDKFIYTGRLFANTKLIPIEKIKETLKVDYDKLIVVSIGGGIDGHDIIKHIIDIKSDLNNGHRNLFLISTGPTISKDKFDKLKKVISHDPLIKITKFNPNLIDYINAADLSISMAGYNSLNNVIITRTQTIVIPRSSDNEQKIRAEKWADKLPLTIVKIEDLKKNILSLLNKDNKKIPDSRENNKFKKIINSIGTLKYLKLRINNNCDCNCDMCSWIKRPKQDLSLQSITNIITDARKLGVRKINLTGGEPTLHPKFVEVYSTIKANRMEVSLSTNLNFNSNILNFLVSQKIGNIDFSLDFFNSDKCDGARKKLGLYNSIIQNIKKLQTNIPELKFHLNFTLRKDNLVESRNIVKFCKENKIPSVSISLITKSELNSDYVNELMLDKEDLSEFYFEIMPELLKEKDQISLSITPFLSRLYGLPNESQILTLTLLKDKLSVQWLDKVFDAYIGKNVTALPLEIDCNLGKEIRVNMDGELSPCCNFDESYIFPSLEEKNIFDFWIEKGWSEFTPDSRCTTCFNNKKF